MRPTPPSLQLSVAVLIRFAPRRWDVEGTDHWSIEPFQEGDMKGVLLEESSFATVRTPFSLSRRGGTRAS